MKDCNHNHTTVNTSRRDVLKALGLGTVALAFPGLMRSAPALAKSADITLKPIPRTGEKVPAVGLGTHMAFDVKPGKPREHLRRSHENFLRRRRPGHRHIPALWHGRGEHW